MASRCVLIVDDEIDIQSSLSFALKDEKYEVLTATLPHEAEQILSKQNVDIAILDVWFPEGDGIELLQKVRSLYPDCFVIMMSGHGNIELALKSIRLGAYDFLEKPLELEKVLVVLRNAVQALDLQSENRRLTKNFFSEVTTLVGKSPATETLRLSIERLALSSSPCLINGETGAGKECAARSMHLKSPRREKAFVSLRCAGRSQDDFERELLGFQKSVVPEIEGRQFGGLELAQDGTLFLDSVSELPFAAQALLVRLLEEKKFRRLGSNTLQDLRCRIVASTTKDLGAEVAAGRFREDLFFRLNVLSLHIPSLRRRVEDLPRLGAHFLQTLAAEYGQPAPRLSGELEQWMARYDWPGNLRELKNVLERMLMMKDPASQTLGLSQLPEDYVAGGPAMSEPFRAEDIRDPEASLRELRGRFERTLLAGRLEQMGGNVTRAAESLGVERGHLHRKLRALGLSKSGEE